MSTMPSLLSISWKVRRSPGEAFDVVAGLERQLDRAVAPEGDPAVRQRDIFAGQPEVDRVPGDLSVGP